MALYVLACGVILFLDCYTIEMVDRSILTYLEKKDFMEKETAENEEGKVNPTHSVNTMDHEILKGLHKYKTITLPALLQVRQLCHREAKNLPRNTELVRYRAGIRTQSSSRVHMFNHDVIVSLKWEQSL